MDPDTIYVKTASGEEAIHQRTRVMQRNVRMVLILVDGHATYADLCLKMGNTKLTGNALRELEAGGFIELRTDQDSIWAESKKVAQEIREAAIKKALQLSALDSKGREAVSVSPVGTVAADEDSSISQFSLTPAQTGTAFVSETPGDFSGRSVEKASGKGKMIATIFFRLFKSQKPKKRSKVDVPISIKVIRRGPRRSLGWFSIMLFGLLGVLSLACICLIAFPYSIFLPEVELAFSQAIGRPVKIATMNVSVYPKLGLLLGDVDIGSGKEELRISALNLQPSIRSLMTRDIRLKQISLQGMAIPLGMISRLPPIFKEMTQHAMVADIERLSLEKVDVSLAGFSLRDMTGEFRLSRGGALQSVVLRSQDQSLNLEVEPVASGLDFSLEGFAWRPSHNSLFLFNSVSLKGSVENNVLSIRDMDLRIFDGLIRGMASVQGDTVPVITGNVSFERINTTRLGQAVEIGSQLSGEASGTIRFSTVVDPGAGVFSEISADGDFSMHRGGIRGIDLAEAVRRAGGAPVQGGVTVFEQLSGRVRLGPAKNQFTGLVMNSGLMQSTGFVEIDKNLAVFGKMLLQMRGSVNQTQVPIVIRGSLNALEAQAGKF